MSCNPVFFWDFTVKAEGKSPEDIIIRLKEIAKKWVFQKEMGAGGYIHYQGRMSLKEKCRNVFWEDGKCSPTSTEGSKTFSYVMKEDTRIEGPWSNKYVRFLQKKVRAALESGLYKWQTYVKEEGPKYQDRILNVIIDTDGNTGKSTLVSLLCYENIARKIPMMSGMTGKDIMQLVMGMPKAKMYLTDFPRATNKKRLTEYFEALEMIKDGYAFDTRYEFEEEWFEVPSMWVFMNEEPDLSLLSRDRWRFWTINEDKELVRYKVRWEPKINLE